ncbi:MAG: SUMF1/EgtB/PvdO family nonheme iron enzyme [Candidatus Binatia bacterium]|jgi:formylglycine-generating enzyme required for sulfatase activity
MKHLTSAVLFTVVIAAPAFAGTLPIITKCPPHAVLVGQTCVDTYEASVWEVPATNLAGKSNAGLINKIKKGTVKLADLTAGNATEISPAIGTGSCSPAFPATFPVDGQWTAPLYAVSIPGVIPTACVSRFQADQACRLSGKRLLTNGEWQSAAAGTPNGKNPDNGATDCNTDSTLEPSNTGSRSGCVSSWGAFDMVGNVYEWVAEWVPESTACPGWGAFSSDFMCLSGASAALTAPGAVARGGTFTGGVASGVFAVDGTWTPTMTADSVGFRCAR